MCVVVYGSVRGAGIFCRNFGAAKEQNLGKTAALEAASGHFLADSPHDARSAVLCCWLLLSKIPTYTPHIARAHNHTRPHPPLPLPTATIATRLDHFVVN